MNTLPKLSTLPLELASKVLAPFAQPGEPMVCLQIHSVGNLTPFRMRGRTNRSYRFEWDRQHLCHVLRVPASLWTAEDSSLARDIYQQMLTRPVIPTLEMPETPTPPPATSEVMQGKPATSASAPAKKTAKKKSNAAATAH